MKKKSNKLDRKFRLRVFLLSFVLFLFIVGYFVGSYLEKSNQKQERSAFDGSIGVLKRIEYQDSTYIEKSAVTTILLIGIDRNDQDLRYGARQGGQADLLMLFAIDHNSKKIFQLHIDRDTMTNVTVYGILGNEVGTRIMQICLSHGYGATEEENDQNTVAAVQSLLQGISIDYYLTLNMESIGVLNDILGGVTVTLEDDFTAYDSQMTAGKTIQLNAEQATIFTRFRIEVGDGSNESRMGRQRVFISAAGELLKERIANQPDFIGELYDALDSIMTTDISRGKLINELNAAYQYQLPPVQTLGGEHEIGEGGFMEFYVEDDAAIQWVLQVLYKPVDE